MTINIEKMRRDLDHNQRLLAWEAKKFSLQLIGAIAATIVATVAAMSLVLHLLGKI